MAKILHGPLVSGISGRLGPVNFRQTYFGQVVQSQPKTVIHKTAAAMASKDTFRTAMKCWANTPITMRRPLMLAATHSVLSPTGTFVKGAMSALRGTPVTASGYTNAPCELTDFVQTDDATHWYLSATFTSRGSTHWGQMLGYAHELATATRRVVIWNEPPGALSLLKANITPPFLVAVAYAMYYFPVDPDHPWEADNPGYTFYLYT